MRPSALAIWGLVGLAVRRSLSGPTRPGMPWRVELLRELIRPYYLELGRRSGPNARRLTDAARTPVPSALLAGVRERSGLLAGRPASWIVPPGTTNGLTVLYLHGGGRVGSMTNYRELGVRIARAASSAVIGLDFRLPPEHPFPAGLDDVDAAFEELVRSGIAAERIVVAGDSSGANLALALMVRRRDRDDSLPTAAVLLSPWTDLAATGPSTRRNADTDIITAEPDDVDAISYLAGLPATTPLASPLYADPTGLPPLLIQAGEAEVLLDDALRFAAAAEAADVEVTSTVWPHQFHVFQLLAAWLPEARAAIDEIGRFVAAHAPH